MLTVWNRGVKSLLTLPDIEAAKQLDAKQPQWNLLDTHMRTYRTSAVLTGSASAVLFEMGKVGYRLKDVHVGGDQVVYVMYAPQ